MTVTVCNQDPSEVGKPTRPYRITSEGRSANVDLCAEHSAPLERFLEPGGTASKGEAGMGRRGRRRATGVTTIEEIEAKKRTPKKAQG